MVKSTQKDFLVGVVFLISAIIVKIFIIPNQASSSNAYGLPPSFFPNFVCYLMIIVSTLLIIQNVKKGVGSVKGCLISFWENLVDKNNRKAYRNATVILVLGIIYFIGLHLIRFIYITPIIIISLALYFGWKRWVSLLVTAIFVTGIVQYLFGEVIKISLP